MAESLSGGDFHEWAAAAAKIHEQLVKEGKEANSLEEQANEFLKAHGYDPAKI
jgi:hypothetical protein